MPRIASLQREAPPSFERLPTDRPDIDAFRRAAEETARILCAGPTDEARLRALEAFDEERARVRAARGLAEARHARDVRRSDAALEQDFHDGAAGAVAAAEASVARAVLALPSPLDLLAARGRRDFERWEEIAHAAAADGAADLIAEEARARTEALRLLACAEGTFRGERRTLAGLAACALSHDPDARRAALEAREDALAPIAERLDACHLRAVLARRRLAAISGPAGAELHLYARAGRRGYDPWSTATARDRAGERAAALRADLLRVQAIKARAEEGIAYADERAFDALPSPEASLPRALLADVVRWLGVAGPPPEGTVETLLARGMIDIEDRAAKIPGARAVDLVDPPLAFVCVAAAGSRDDPPALLAALAEAHRIAACPVPKSSYVDSAARAPRAVFGAGGAAARGATGGGPSVERPRDRSPLAARDAGGASRETCRALLPLLALGSYETFFGPEAGRARFAYVADLCAEIARLAALDRYEHGLYSVPGASPGDRDAAFRAAQEALLPWRDPSASALDRVAEPLLHEGAYAAQDRLLGILAALALWGRVRLLGRREAAVLAGEALHAASREPFTALCARLGIAAPLDPPAVDDAIGVLAGWLDECRYR